MFQGEETIESQRADLLLDLNEFISSATVVQTKCSVLHPNLSGEQMMSHFATLLSQIRRIVTNPAYNDKRLLRQPMETFSEVARDTENLGTVDYSKILLALHGLLLATKTSAKAIENRSVSPTPAAEVIDCYEGTPASENGRDLMITLMQSLEQKQNDVAEATLPSRFLSVKSDPPAVANTKLWESQVIRKVSSAMDLAQPAAASFHLSTIEKSPIAGALIHFVLSRDNRRSVAAQMTSGQLRRIAQDVEHLFPGQFSSVSRLLDDESVDIATLFRAVQQYFGLWSTNGDVEQTPSLIEIIAPAARNPHKPLPPKPSIMTRSSSNTNSNDDIVNVYATLLTIL